MRVRNTVHHGEFEPVRKLLRRIENLRSEYLTGAKARAADYNIFRVLDVESKEVKTHSAFLAHLLDPAGDHAQGPLFLDSFLSHFLRDRKRGKPPASDWFVETEWVIPGGRIDILLGSRSEGTVIAIENKIDALEGEYQLKRYREWLDSDRVKQAYPVRQELVYLTPDGCRSQDPSTGTIDYRCLSYRKNVHSILLKLDIQAPAVRYCVDQYLQTLSKLSTNQPMETEQDRMMVDLLSQPENVPHALAILRCGTALRRRALEEFWRKGQEHLQKKVRRLKRPWLVIADNGPVDGEYGIKLAIKTGEGASAWAIFRFHQYSTGRLFRWEHCVRLADGSIKPSRARQIQRLGEVAELGRELNKQGMEPRHGWDGYMLLTDDRKGVDRILEEELSGGLYFDQFFADGFYRFQQLELSLWNLNEAVRALHQA